MGCWSRWQHLPHTRIVYTGGPRVVELRVSDPGTIMLALALAVLVVGGSPPPPGPSFEYGGLRLELSHGALTGVLLNATAHQVHQVHPRSSLPPPPAPPPNHDYNFIGPRGGAVPKQGCHLLGDVVIRVAPVQPHHVRLPPQAYVSTRQHASKQASTPDRSDPSPDFGSYNHALSSSRAHRDLS